MSSGSVANDTGPRILDRPLEHCDSAQRASQGKRPRFFVGNAFALKGNAVKDFPLCFRAKGPSVPIAWAIGPSQCVARVAKPQSGRPFDENTSNCRPVGPASMINRRLPRPMALAIWNGWPIGPESQRVASLSFLLFCNPPNLTTKNPSQRCRMGCQRIPNVAVLPPLAGHVSSCFY